MTIDKRNRRLAVLVKAAQMFGESIARESRSSGPGIDDIMLMADLNVDKVLDECMSFRDGYESGSDALKHAMAHVVVGAFAARWRGKNPNFALKEAAKLIEAAERRWPGVFDDGAPL